jgi:hypothetical protein
LAASGTILLEALPGPQLCCGRLKPNVKVNEMPGLVWGHGTRKSIRRQWSLQASACWDVTHFQGWCKRKLSLGTVWEHLQGQHRPGLCLHFCARLIILSHLSLTAKLVFPFCRGENWSSKADITSDSDKSSSWALI